MEKSKIQQSKDNYLNIKVDTFVVRVPKGKKELIQQHARDIGKSLNSYIVELITTDMSYNMPPAVSNNGIIQSGNVNNSNTTIQNTAEIPVSEEDKKILSAFHLATLKEKEQILSIISKYDEE